MNYWFPGKLIISNDPSRLAEVIDVRRPSLIGIDGAPAAGKSCLGRALADRLRWRHADLDDQLDGDGRPFVAQMKPNVLASVVENRPVIISGVCLLAALELVGARPDLLVYVARVTREDLPADLELRDEDLDPERASGRHMPRSRFWAELRAYHRRHRPISAAHVVFTVPEPEPAP